MGGPAGTGRRVPHLITGRRGFTLLEVMVVLLILSVLGVVAVPALQGPPREPALDEGAGRVEALFRMARNEAVRSGRAVTVVLDSTSALAWVDTRDRVDGESLELPSGVTLELPRARASFTFHPGGGAEGDSVVVRGPGDVIRIVTVNRWSGHAAIR
jgi:type II secretion system protein H